jgi:hypothetical protein
MFGLFDFIYNSHQKNLRNQMKVNVWTVCTVMLMFIGLLQSCRGAQPTVVFNRADLEEVKKAEIYL